MSYYELHEPLSNLVPRVFFDVARGKVEETLHFFSSPSTEKALGSGKAELRVSDMSLQLAISPATEPAVLKPVFCTSFEKLADASIQCFTTIYCSLSYALW